MGSLAFLVWVGLSCPGRCPGARNTRFNTGPTSELQKGSTEPFARLRVESDMKKSPDFTAFDRRELLKLLGVGGLVHSAALAGCAPHESVGVASPVSPGAQRS